MLTLSDYREKPPTAWSRAAVTIGNFDGCHRGHRRLAEAALEARRELGAAAVALSFAPRAEDFFRGTPPPPLLFTPAQKIRAFSELGFEALVAQRFDAAFAAQMPRTFYQEVLRDGLCAAAVIIGENFRFGHKREGDAVFLRAAADKDGIRVSIGAAVRHGGEPISSTRIREALADRGDAGEASVMLGRPYMLEGRIKKGDQLGRQLGVPTANLEEVAQLVPRFGVYAGFVQLGARPEILAMPKTAIPAVYAIGVRPTLDQKGPPPVRIEAHLLAGTYGADALYGMEAGFYFTHWLRPELRFDGLEALKTQMAADIAAARRLCGL